jgi:hypothetical protein
MLGEVNPTLLQQLNRILRINVVVQRELEVELPGRTVLGAVALGVGEGEAELDDLRKRRKGGREGGISLLVFGRNRTGTSLFPSLPHSLPLPPSLPPYLPPSLPTFNKSTLHFKVLYW